MYIIFVDANRAVQTYRVDNLSIGAGHIQVSVQNTGTGQAASMSNFYQSITVPLMPLSTDPLGDVATWLVSADGPLTGGILATGERYEFLALQLRMQLQVKARRDALRDGIAPTPFGGVNTDVTGRDNLLAVDRLLQLAEKYGQSAEPVLFTMADDQDVELTRAEFEQMMLAVGNYGMAVHRRKRDLQAEIDAAETVAELEAVGIESGWPPIGPDPVNESLS